MSEEQVAFHDPAASWRRGFLIACAAAAAVTLAAVLLTWASAKSEGGPTVPMLVGLVLLVPLLALGGTLAVAGRPARGLRVGMRGEALVVEKEGRQREIPAARFRDWRRHGLILDDGEVVPVPDAIRPATAALFRRGLLACVRGEGRTYLHEGEAPGLVTRVAVAYLLLFTGAVLAFLLGLAIRAGGLGTFAAVVGGGAVAWVLHRQLVLRRVDRARAEALEHVRLDARGIEVVEHGGETSLIPWDEVVAVPPPRWNDAVIVETEELVHALPRSFHPTLARDLRLVWHETVTEAAEEQDDASVE